MAASNIPKKSIADLEQQIAKVTAALEKARAQELAAAKKAVASEQKTLAASEKKLAVLSAKDVSKSKTQITQLKKEISAQTKKLAIAQEQVESLSARLSAASEVSKLLQAGSTKSSEKKVITPAQKKAGKSAPTRRNNPAETGGETESLVQPAKAKKTKTAPESAENIVPSSDVATKNAGNAKTGTESEKAAQDDSRLGEQAGVKKSRTTRTKKVEGPSVEPSVDGPTTAAENVSQKRKPTPKKAKASTETAQAGRPIVKAPKVEEPEATESPAMEGADTDAIPEYSTETPADAPADSSASSDQPTMLRASDDDTIH